jgi:hypothetical protein
MVYWRSALLGPNSRFGGFNSRLGGCKFPFGTLREFARNGLICLAVFQCQNGTYWAKSKKFPVLREKPGILLRRLVRHDDRAGGREHAADTVADQDPDAWDRGKSRARRDQDQRAAASSH